MRAERAALRRQPHPARGAHEERDAELALEVLDPRRQRGLRHVENAGRLAHRPPFGDGEERLDLGEQHTEILTLSMEGIETFDLSYTGGRGMVARNRRRDEGA